MSDHRRFFIRPDQINDNLAELDGATAVQIGRVLRLKPGDTLVLLDGSGVEIDARIDSISKTTVRAEIIESRQSTSEPDLKLSVGVCLPKRDKMDMVVQKCTELGVSEFLVAESERTIARPGLEKVEGRLARWQKIATEAAEQSRRAVVPAVRGIMTYKELAAGAAEFDLALVAWENEPSVSLGSILKQNPKPGSAIVIIGPEGGLTQNEVDSAKSAGAQAVNLGKRLLRSETAAIAACAAIMYEVEGEL